MFQLQVGQVLHLWCAACRPPKFKFFIVALIVPRVRYFLINSNASPLQAITPELASGLVQLRQNEHAFLHHDSLMDCTQLMGGPTASDLEDLYQKSPDILKGNIAIGARRAGRHVIQSSALLSQAEISALLSIW